MNEKEIKLPRSSFEEIKKILIGYAHLGGKDIPIERVAKLLGVNKSIVSGNNGFLMSVGLLEGGKTKSLTPVGTKLARAFQHHREEDAKKYLQEVIQNSEFLSSLVSTLRIKGGMTEDDFVQHVLYVADLNPTKSNKTGARTIIDLLKDSGFVKEQEGYLVVGSGEISTKQSEGIAESKEEDLGELPGEALESKEVKENSKGKRHYRVVVSRGPSITINIQLQIPATENAAVYQNLFKALREYLFDVELETNDD